VVEATRSRGTQQGPIELSVWIFLIAISVGGGLVALLNYVQESV
jgi:hypothetical protein